MRAPALLLAAALCTAACIEKPLRPSERERDGGGPDAGGGCGAEPAGEGTAWTETDEIRFNHRVGLIDADCRDDMVIPGSRADGLAPGVFVVLGRESGFMDGFDSFVDTDGRQPVDLTLSNLIGADEAVDLMVLATDAADTHILVYRGDGAGGFIFHAEKAVEALELQAGPTDAPAPLYLFLAQLEPDAAPSLVFGDSANIRILSPADWGEPDSIDSAAVVTPSIFTLDNQTQELGVVGMPGRPVDDLFDMAALGARWYANDDGVEAFMRSPEMAVGIEGPGPSVFLDMDADGDPDVTSIRFQGNPQLETLVLQPNVDPSMPGTIATVARFDQGLAAGGDRFTDFDLRSLGGGTEPEAFLVNPDFDDGSGDTGSMLVMLHDLTVDGDTITSPMEPFTFLHDHELTARQPNRIAIGQFREGVTEVRVFGSAPAIEAGFCLQVSEAGDGLELCGS